MFLAIALFRIAHSHNRHHTTRTRRPEILNYFFSTMCSLKLVFLVALLFVITESSMDKPPMVKTKFGLIAGKWTTSARDLPIANYLGIPYAEPPVGDLRFRSPQPWTSSWTGIRDAIEDGTPCIQRTLNDVIIGNEDCLYLNVFVPQITDIRFANYRQPVLVFIHGGSFNIGRGSSSYYSPIYWADQQVILVVMNYRLGPFGFFSLASEAAPGNYGLKDMLLALQWVQENIADFGGDPDHVTLMGQSAGAGAAHVLALSEKTKGLFDKYILHSGSAFGNWALHPKKKIKRSSLNIARSLGCPPFVRNVTEEVENGNDTTTWMDYLFSGMENEDFDEQIIECMRSVNASTILQKVPEQYLWIKNPYCIFGPTLEDDSIEDAILSIPPMEIIEKHLFRDMPAIIGVVLDEGLLKTREVFRQEFAQKFIIENFELVLPTFLESQEIVTNVSEFVRAIEDFYFNGNVRDNFMNNVTEMTGDGLITWPTYKAVKYLSEVMESNLYFFWFCYESTSSNTGSLGINHGDELRYLFNSWNYDYSGKPQDNTEDDWTMINIMTEMWANFMRNGVPKAWRTAEWPDYRDHREFMRFGAGTVLNIEVESDFLSDRMEFWESLMSNVTERTSDLDLMIKSDEEEKSTVSRAYNTQMVSSFLFIVTTLATSVSSLEI